MQMLLSEVSYGPLLNDWQKKIKIPFRGKGQQAGHLRYYTHSVQHLNKNMWDQPTDKNDQKQTKTVVNRNRLTGKLDFRSITCEL